MLSTNQKGAIAEAAILRAATHLEIGVSRPLLQDERYDFIFDLGHSLLRVQCKWVTKQGDVVVIRCYSARRSGDGLIRRSYSKHEVDLLVAYCAEVDRCYVLPPELFSGRREVCSG